MTKKSDDSTAKPLDIGQLIEQLGPLNNRWRDSEPSEKVLALWDMGEIILAVVPNPSDPLLWDIQKRSYLTRSLLRYALIVRRGWKRRRDLAELVRGLRSYTAFREALPFLKGDREGIDDETYGKVASFLGDANPTTSVQYLKRLKARKIGRTHKKGSSVAAIRDQATSFGTALTELETEAARGNVLPGLATSASLVALSQIAMAVATEESVTDLPSATANMDRLIALAEPLLSAARGGRASVAAFRKVVRAERLMQAADLLNSLRGESSLDEWRRRRRADVLQRAASMSTREGVK
ncbi:MAG: hypothetical protein DMF61_26590 [Blastocatellia bacterium AA13]|nr:MAG: hypothetical protein DMF61_26590 [Blastocatellia bacterium AA13]